MERLPIPIAIAFDRQCERVQGNRAFRQLTGRGDVRYLAGGVELAPPDLPLHRAARDGVDVLDVNVKLVRDFGAHSDLVASAWPLQSLEGVVEGSIGVYLDVTQAREARMRYEMIAEAIPSFVWLDAPDGGAQYANRRWLEYTGLTEEQNFGYGWEVVVHPEDAARLQSERERTLRSGEPFEDECRYRGKDGKYRWFLFRSIPVRDDDGNITSWLGTATDIDRQKRAEAQQAFFALASDVLGSTLEESTTLERIARLAIASLGTWCQIDLPDARGDLRVAVVAHQDPGKEKVLAQLCGHRVYDSAAKMGPPAVLHTLKPQLLQQVDDEAVAYVIPDPRHRGVYRTIGYTAGMIVPLRIRDRVLGVLGIASDDPSRLYTEFDVTTALELGRRGAIALENAQSFAREHRVATTLQRALLPASLPHSDKARFASAYSAAASHQGEAVGGDWYDAFPVEGGRIAVSMGDVAGHGLDAAVTMGVVRQAIRAAALEMHGPKDVLVRANRVVMLEHAHPMITAAFGLYNPHTREFTYSLAGHPPPVVLRADGSIEVLSGSGPPMGDAFDEVLLEQQRVLLQQDSTVIFFTDGLIEYRRDVLTAERRLHQVLSKRAFLQADNPAQAIIDGVLDAPQQDDIAVLVLRV
ncbi:MAG TPA: SpoIIE family protein phosphatase [Candidatus Baltobacteraceae bacterium]|nr:SpoIIE family protein phosphatase [Candidatus Baltobacteraceae bacterium]